MTNLNKQGEQKLCLVGFGEQSDEVECERDVLDISVGGGRPGAPARGREAGTLLGDIVTRGRSWELRLVSLEAGAGGRGHTGIAAHQRQLLERDQGGDDLEVAGEECAGNLRALEAVEDAIIGHEAVLGLCPHLGDDPDLAISLGGGRDTVRAGLSLVSCHKKAL